MSNTLARKVTKSKWNNQLNEQSKIVSADAITSCLRTKNNTISVWNVEDTEDAVLALACVNTSLAIVDIVKFNKKRLEELEIDFTPVKSNNPVGDLNEKHFDIINLNYQKLGVLADEIANETINDSEYIIRYSKSQVKEIIQQAIDSGRIDIEILNDNLKKSLKL